MFAASGVGGQVVEREVGERVDDEVGLVEREPGGDDVGTATVKIPAAFAARTPSASPRRRSPRRAEARARRAPRGRAAAPASRDPGRRSRRRSSARPARAPARDVAVHPALARARDDRDPSPRRSASSSRVATPSRSSSASRARAPRAAAGRAPRRGRVGARSGVQTTAGSNGSPSVPTFAIQRELELVPVLGVHSLPGVEARAFRVHEQPVEVEEQTPDHPVSLQDGGSDAAGCTSRWTCWPRPACSARARPARPGRGRRRGRASSPRRRAASRLENRIGVGGSSTITSPGCRPAGSRAACRTACRLRSGRRSRSASRRPARRRRCRPARRRRAPPVREPTPPSSW